MADLKVLSLGAGVQSSTLLYLAIDGEIELDVAIFADTQWERARVYDHMDKLEALAQPAGIEMRRITHGNLRERVLVQEKAPEATGTRYVTLPLYTRHKDGRKGLMVRRVCTYDYKVAPIRREVRRMMKDRGLTVRGESAAKVDQLMGISWDEVQRMQASDISYINNVYPLIDMRWTRQQCIDYIQDRGYPMPAKSACIGCPFHDDGFWREMRDESPKEWEDAVTFDNAIRHGMPSQSFEGTAFIHRSRQPLETADLSGAAIRGQGNLFDGGFEDVCDDGHCGV